MKHSASGPFEPPFAAAACELQRSRSSVTLPGLLQSLVALFAKTSVAAVVAAFFSALFSRAFSEFQTPSPLFSRSILLFPFNSLTSRRSHLHLHSPPLSFSLSHIP